MTGTSSSSPASVLNVRVTATDAAVTASVTIWGVFLGGS
jgi:hypothetical protein